MRLVLSTAAAADCTLDELLAACARRGLAGLELVSGHGHGIGPALDPVRLEEHRLRAEGRGIPIVAFRAADRTEAYSPAAARLSAALRAPIIAPRDGDRPPEEALLAAAATYAHAGGTLLLEHGSDPAEVARLRHAVERAPARALALAWDVDPAAGDVSGAAASVLEVAGPSLRHIRLLGGGPEAAQHEGRGIGALMARLTLRGYDGALALAPSTPRYRIAWSAWLGRSGGWGCGSKAADPSLVRLDRALT
ncbi:MAG TPA: hypothetical protein VF188_04850 [Longimicrobiales bacterium]